MVYPINSGTHLTPSCWVCKKIVICSILCTLSNSVFLLVTEPFCAASENAPSVMIDRFENRNKPSHLWDSIRGGMLATGCGVIDTGNSLYFSDEGTREAQTKELDTTDIRLKYHSILYGPLLPLLTSPTSRHDNSEYGILPWKIYFERFICQILQKSKKLARVFKTIATTSNTLYFFILKDSYYQ